MRKRIALILLSLTAGAWGAGQDVLSLERTYLAGETDRYLMRLSFESQLGAVDVAVTTQEKVKKVYDSGDADIEIEVIRFTAKMAGHDVPTDPQPEKPKKSIVRRDKFGGVLLVDGKSPETAKGTGGFGGTNLQRYLNIGSIKELRLGQATMVESPDPADPAKKVRLTATFESVANGVAKIVSIAEVNTLGPKTSKIHMSTFVDAGTGKVVKAEGTIIGIGGPSMPSDTVQFTIERVVKE